MTSIGLCRRLPSATSEVSGTSRVFGRSARRLRLFAPAVLAAAFVAGCGSPKPKPVVSGPFRQQQSDASARKSVAVTVYNSNFGLVREQRRIKLGTGAVALSYADVSAHIQPETVHIKSVTDANALTVLEQNYRYDLLTPEKLLEKYVGRSIKVARYNEQLGTDEIRPAEVLAVEGGVVLRVGGEVVTDFRGRFIFPEVPENLVAEPTLVWLLASAAAEQTVEVTYLTRNLSWHADYVMVVDANDQKGDLTGWVTLDNRSGTSYQGATLKLVAGDVQRIAPEPATEAYDMAEAAPAAPPAPPQFRQESLFEYHLYSLSRPTDLLDKEQKQVALIEAHGVSLKKKLVFRSADYWFLARQPNLPQNQKVRVLIELENKEEKGLGMPLPKGVVRVYKADQSGAQQFVGEDAIDHTPRDETIEVTLGEAFDVVADRKQTDFRTLSRCMHESAWSIALRNHKDKAETVEVIEPVNNDWEIVSSSHHAKKEDAHTFKFTVPVPSRGEVTVAYRVRVRFC